MFGVIMFQFVVNFENPVRRAPSGRYTMKKGMKTMHHENTSPFEKVLTRMMIEILHGFFSKIERNEKEKSVEFI